MSNAYAINTMKPITNDQHVACISKPLSPPSEGLPTNTMTTRIDKSMIKGTRFKPTLPMKTTNREYMLSQSLSQGISPTAG